MKDTTRIDFKASRKLERELEGAEVIYYFVYDGRGFVGAWFGGESHMAHWYTLDGREIALCTRSDDKLTPGEMLQFFSEHTTDFYDNWAADQWEV